MSWKTYWKSMQGKTSPLYFSSWVDNEFLGELLNLAFIIIFALHKLSEKVTRKRMFYFRAVYHFKCSPLVWILLPDTCASLAWMKRWVYFVQWTALNLMLSLILVGCQHCSKLGTSHVCLVESIFLHGASPQRPNFSFCFYQKPGLCILCFDLWASQLLMNTMLSNK